MNFYPDEAVRRREFPVCAGKVFLAHAGVTALPRGVAEAVCAHTLRSAEMPQEFAEVLRDVKEARRVCAGFIGGDAQEVALLGPTSLGLSLFANGLPWQEGDEVLCYRDDYPANVYPWLEQRRRGVRVRYLEPERPGEITPELVEAAAAEPGLPAAKSREVSERDCSRGSERDLERDSERNSVRPLERSSGRAS